MTIVLVLLSTCLPARGQGVAPDFVGKFVRALAAPADAPMFMPTDVAVTNNRVFVADGVNSRIVVFDRSGEFLELVTQVADIALSNPIGLDVDVRGDLWIADAGLGRIIVRQSGGGIGAVHEPPPSAHRPDLTDVALNPSGDKAWVVDNDGNRVLLLNVATNAWESIVPSSPAVAIFNHPFMAAVAEDRLYVTDVVNGRVRSIVGMGTLGASLGNYGLGPGQLYRPKGVALDDSGRVWVTEGVLGRVTIFAADGSSSAMLKDNAGKHVQLASPMGLTLAGRDLFVVELSAQRVSQFEISPGQLQKNEDKREAAGPRQPQQCTVCHIDWLPDFGGVVREGLLWRPVDPAQPMASDQRMCLSCHDTSIVDSRERVWRQHGHTVGTKLADSMTPPRHLPLVNGELACRTCHSAHTHGGTTMETAVFLRVEKSPDELCVACHADYRDQNNVGWHPTGAKLQPLPHNLPRARSGLKVPEVMNGCVVCHSGHGVEDRNLLVASPDVLCLSCHTAVAGQLADSKLHSQVHPVVSVSADRQLDCLSCHKMHHSPEPASLLVRPTRDAALCRSCHPGYETVLGTAHDFWSPGDQVDAPQRDSRPGGSCGACHGIHTPALELSPSAANPLGDCASCHRGGGLATNIAGHQLAHPIVPHHQVGGAAPGSIECRTCHDPHTQRNSPFLRAAPDELCAQCHAEQTESLAGAHALSGTTRVRNALNRPADVTGNCGFCHSMHQGIEPALWAVSSQRPADAAALCTTCHAGDGLFPHSAPPPVMHPTGHGLALAKPPADSPSLAQTLVSEIWCGTCHNPHANSGSNPAMLRLMTDRGETELCYTCHADTRGIENSMHAARFVQPPGGSTNVCGPCHAVHGGPSPKNAAMWHAALGTKDAVANNAVCTGCHSTAAGRHDINFKSHPLSPIRTVLGDDACTAMPLAGSDSRDCAGHITCVTCHTPHGRTEQQAVPPRLDEAPLAIFRASKPMLRPYEAPNLCSSCHGFDGLRLFLTFHGGALRK